MIDFPTFAHQLLCVKFGLLVAQYQQFAPVIIKARFTCPIQQQFIVSFDVRVRGFQAALDELQFWLKQDEFYRYGHYLANKAWI